MTMDALVAWHKRCWPRSTLTASDFEQLAEFSMNAAVDTPGGFELLAAAPRLRRLRIEGDYTENDLAGLARLADIEYLRVWGRGMDAGFLRFAAGWQCLHTLELHVAFREPALFRLESVAILRLSGCDIADGLPALPALPNLRDLVAATTRLPASTLAQVGTWSELERCQLSADTLLTDATLASFKNLTRLRALAAWGDAITDAGFDLFGAMPGLVELRLGGLEQVTDVGLAALARLRSIETLELIGTRAEGSFLRALARGPARKTLTHLDLAGAPLDGEHLPELAAFTNLRRLGLSNTRLRDAEVERIPALPSLEAIDLDGTRVTQGGLVALGLPLLERVVMDRKKSLLRRALAELHKRTVLPAGEVLVLRIVGTVGHAHYDETFVHDDAKVLEHELHVAFDRAATTVDLEEGLEVTIVHLCDDRIVQRIDVMPHLRLHALAPDGRLGTPRPLMPLLTDEQRRARIRAELQSGKRDYVLRVQTKDLQLPTLQGSLAADAKIMIRDLDARRSERRVVRLGWNGPEA